jgi:membrane associated rhomboid family serine protease
MQAAIAYLGVNLVLGLILPGIAFVAHIAGFAGGMILGLCASPSIADKPASSRGLPTGGI